MRYLFFGEVKEGRSRRLAWAKKKSPKPTMDVDVKDVLFRVERRGISFENVVMTSNTAHRNPAPKPLNWFPAIPIPPVADLSRN